MKRRPKRTHTRPIKSGQHNATQNTRNGIQTLNLNQLNFWIRQVGKLEVFEIDFVSCEFEN